jgi:ferrous iron transport protein A
MPLAMAPTNTELKIVKILAEDKTKKHLENLGITINSVITVLSHHNGNSICVVKDGRLALDGDVSRKILVA